MVNLVWLEVVKGIGFSNIWQMGIQKFNCKVDLLDTEVYIYHVKQYCITTASVSFECEMVI